MMWSVLCGLASTVFAAQDGEVELRIVHTNDTHSCVMPVNPNSSDTALADKGGFVRRATLVRDLRAEDPDLLLFDSGDFSQGSAYYNLYKGDVEVKLMNEMRYDAATIGNHEFDFGLDNMARIFREAAFPIVCANYHFEGTVLEGLVRPYVILERKGVKVGVFGLGTQLEGMVASENYKGVTYEDPVTAANLVSATRHIDIVLGGHSHTYFEHPEVLKNADGEDVYCNQMGKHGRYVGMLLLEMSPTGD